MSSAASIRFLLTVGALSLLAAGCALPLVSESEVDTESERYFEALKQKQPISSDANLTRYVNCVTNAIVAQLEPEFSSREWEVVVFEDEEIQAFAIAGEKIGVHTGLFKVIENQAQLATVLGHEVAHVTQKHTLENARRARTTYGGVLLAGAALGGGAAFDLAGMAAELGLTKPFRRGAEKEADAVGLRYMAAAGFDPRQSVPLWQNMAKKSKLGPPEFLSTHPSDEKRLSSLIELFPETLVLYNQAQAAGKKPSCQR